MKFSIKKYVEYNLKYPVNLVLAIKQNEWLLKCEGKTPEEITEMYGFVVREEWCE